MVAMTDLRSFASKIQPWYRKAKRYEYEAVVALFCVLFNLAYTQTPLFYADQNTYFLHGMADAGFGFLSDDWLAKGTDPFPVFTVLVSFTVRFLHPNFFYLYHALLVSVFLIAILKIVRSTFGIDYRKSEAPFILFFSVFVLCNSLLVARYSQFISDLHRGLSGFSYPGVFLVPSVFGAFLFLSIGLFLERKKKAAVCFAALAATIHPTYILHASTLVAAYLVFEWYETKSHRSVVKLGALFTALVLPIVIRTKLTLVADPIPGVLERAEDIMVHFRSPHHAEVGRWAHRIPGKLALFAVALYLTRTKRIARILLSLILVSGSLTLYRFVFDDLGIALMMPWRMAIVVAPISLAIVVAASVLTVEKKMRDVRIKGRRVFSVAAIASLVVCLYSGYYGGRLMTRYFKPSFDTSPNDNFQQLVEFVSNNMNKGDTYVIPPDMIKRRGFLNFRLQTGAPIFVDKKSHPYRSDEVLEWYERLRTTEDMYQSGKERRCGKLNEMLKNYDITHVVTENHALPCDNTKQIFKQGVYGVHVISSD